MNHTLSRNDFARKLVDVHVALAQDGQTVMSINDGPIGMHFECIALAGFERYEKLCR